MKNPEPRDGAIPAVAGIGLRDPHFEEIDARRPELGWLEVHAENFFGDDPRRHGLLRRLREQYPLSLHGVGLSLGSVDPPDASHLRQLRELVRHHEPWIVSEHCSWGSIDGRYSNNLLPLPRTTEALDTLCANVGKVQDALGRSIAIENIASYLEFRHSTLDEAEFLTALTWRTGCGLLLDLNNLHVNAINHGFDAAACLRRLPAQAVVEYHLAGYDDRGHTLIDTHGRPVAEPVWALYAEALRLIGPRPTLIEWDTDIPPLGVLLGERERAQSLLMEFAHAAA